MFTKLLLTGSVFGFISTAAHAVKDYENFNLPKPAVAAIPESKLNFGNERVQLKGKNVKLKTPSVSAQQFIFAKEAYISEKRDEAIKILRQQMDSAPKANRDNILLRLGQLYAEKYMELSYREGEVYADGLSNYETRKATQKSAQPPKLDNTRSKGYLNDALKIFYQLEKEFPNTPKIDEALFFIGFVELESGNDKKGISYLEKVVKNYPRSRKYDEAVLYLADYYFDKHNFKEAQRRFRTLMTRGSGLQDYAQYKLAWCELNIGSPSKALQDMKRLVSKLQGVSDNQKFNLREQALKDLVVFYGDSDNVEDAIAYFEETQGKEKAMENLKLLADIYRTKAKDKAAEKAYVRLIKEFPESPDTLNIYLGLYDAQSRLGKTDAAIKNLVAAIETFGAASGWAEKFPEDKRETAKSSQNNLAMEAEKVAFFHHQAAQKSASKAHYDFAIKMYNVILKGFPEHPNKKKLAFFRGEALFNQMKYVEASDSYMMAAKTPPKDKMSDEAVYNALLSLDGLTSKANTLNRYSKEDQKTIDTKPQEIPEAEKKFLDVAEYYLSEYPSGDRVVDVRFRIAGIYYRRHHFDEAQEKFKEIALKHPKHRSATTAAHIVLDIYNIKKDYANMQKTAEMFVGVKELGDPEFRKELAQIAGEIDFKGIEKLEGDSKWADAGDSYMSFYKKDPNGALAEKSLYNAYVSYEKANDTAKSSDVAKLFIAKYPKSGYATRMRLAIAKNAENLYDFQQAQHLYEDFYDKNPKDKDAKKALYNAAVFAELLEMNTKALTLYEEYLKKESPNTEEKRSIWISQAKLYRKTNQWDKFTQTYRRLMRDSRSADEKAGYLAEMTRQFEKAGRVDDKNNALNELRALFKNDKSVKGLAAQYLAESEFKSIAKQREKYEEVKLRFPPEDLIYLLKRKQKMLTKLAESYDRVVEVGVPEWGVAALFEKGAAYDNLVRNFRTLQVPKRYKGDEKTEIESALKGIDAQLVLPIDKKAQEVFRACTQRAADFKVINEYSSHCRERYHVAENEVVNEPTGLLPQPNYWSTRALQGEVAKR